MKIKSVKAREILDSRGIPTIETEVYLEDGSLGVASVPSGTHLGKFEAKELRDNDLGRFHGMGVLKAIEYVEKLIGPRIVGLDASFQGKLDQLLVELDGTEDKSKLGGNTLLSVSQAVLEASAASYKIPIYKYLQQKYQLSDKIPFMPIPIFNLINGGKNGTGNLDFQEFHIIPSSRKNYLQALECGQGVYQALKKTLIYRRAGHSVGDKGGFTPNLFTNMDALEVLLEAINNAGYKFAREIFVGVDVAARYFYKNGKYVIKDRSQPFSAKEMIQYYISLNNEYQLFSLEDAFYEEDWGSWQQINKQIGQDTLIIGDSLLVGNKERVAEAIKKKACNAFLIKPNQIGTISETIMIVKMAKDAGWQVIASHRSGETNDDFMADFSVGIGANYVKFGAPARGERVIKYNRLLRIFEESTENVKNQSV